MPNFQMFESSSDDIHKFDGAIIWSIFGVVRSIVVDALCDSLFFRDVCFEDDISSWGIISKVME